MQAARYDMTIPRGASFSREFARYKDEAEQEPFDYTGYTFEWIIGTTMTLSLGSGLLLPELHVLRLELTPTDTVKAPNFQQDHHKLWLKRPDGGIDPLLKGVVTWKTP